MARALTKAGQAAGLSFTTPEANSLGASLLGGGTLSEAFKAVEQGGADTVIILENDLYLRAPAAAVDRFLDAARHVIVIDHLETPTVAKAELALPAGAFAESDGTLVNNEGRAQRFFQAYVPKEDIQESWRWLLEVMRVAGRGEAEPGTRWMTWLPPSRKAVPALDKDYGSGAVARSSGSWARRFPALRTATAGAPPCWPTSTSASRSPRKTRIPPSPSPWKAIRINLQRP